MNDVIINTSYSNYSKQWYSKHKIVCRQLSRIPCFFEFEINVASTASCGAFWKVNIGAQIG